MTARRGWWNLTCWNALSAAQRERLITVGNLPIGYEAEGTDCTEPATVAVETAADEAPGPRFYCVRCAILHLAEAAPSLILCAVCQQPLTPTTDAIHRFYAVYSNECAIEKMGVEPDDYSVRDERRLGRG